MELGGKMWSWRRSRKNQRQASWDLLYSGFLFLSRVFFVTILLFCLLTELSWPCLHSQPEAPHTYCLHLTTIKIMVWGAVEKVLEQSRISKLSIHLATFHVHILLIIIKPTFWFTVIKKVLDLEVLLQVQWCDGNSSCINALKLTMIWFYLVQNQNNLFWAHHSQTKCMFKWFLGQDCS